jgi:hypothetical protein
MANSDSSSRIHRYHRHHHHPTAPAVAARSVRGPRPRSPRGARRQNLCTAARMARTKPRPRRHPWVAGSSGRRSGRRPPRRGLRASATTQQLEQHTHRRRRRGRRRHHYHHHRRRCTVLPRSSARRSLRPRCGSREADHPRRLGTSRLRQRHRHRFCPRPRRRRPVSVVPVKPMGPVVECGPPLTRLRLYRHDPLRAPRRRSPLLHPPPPPHHPSTSRPYLQSWGGPPLFPHPSQHRHRRPR